MTKKTLFVIGAMCVVGGCAIVHCNVPGWGTEAAAGDGSGESAGRVVSPACDPDGHAPCPDDYFVCTVDEVGNKYCEGQGDATPDSGAWSCEVQGSTLVCSGDHVPSDAGDWQCDEIVAGQVTCRRAGYVPSEGAEGSWACTYEENHLVCESAGGDGTKADDASGGGSDGCAEGTESPSDEICDGRDNDCDGTVDEDCSTTPPSDLPPGGDDGPPPGDENPPGGDDGPPPSDDVPPGGDDGPPPGDDTPPGGDSPPPGCVCVPGAWRYCDTPTYCRWGIQYCDADGMAWGDCTETAPPTICTVTGNWYSSQAEACCIASGYCCQDMWDLDLDGDVTEALGDCTDIMCE